MGRAGVVLHRGAPARSPPAVRLVPRHQLRRHQRPGAPRSGRTDLRLARPGGGGGRLIRPARTREEPERPLSWDVTAGPSPTLRNGGSRKKAQLPIDRGETYVPMLWVFGPA